MGSSPEAANVGASGDSRTESTARSVSGGRSAAGSGRTARQEGATPDAPRGSNLSTLREAVLPGCHVGGRGAGDEARGVAGQPFDEEMSHVTHGGSSL